MSKLLFLVVVCIYSMPTYAAQFSLDIGEGPFSARLLQLFAAISILSLAPSILVMVTSFTRIVVVMSILRQAVGLHQSPPASVVMALSLFLTFFVMQPTFEKSYQEGLAPYLEDKLPQDKALEKTAAPFHTFMLKNVRE